jgi:division protein CdvB (Snf7/Vps24/ESCRT-III family)
MAIKIELAELKRITTRSKDLYIDLNSTLSKVETELDAICTNVRSSELTSANENLVSSINTVSDKIKTNLPVINEFLSSQIDAYNQTNIDTKSEIDSLVSSISGTFSK